MKTLSYTFFTTEELQEKLQESENFNSSSTLIQIFCADSERESVENIRSYFIKVFPNTLILGTTTDGIIFKNTIVKEHENVVTFTVFEKTKLEGKIFLKEDYKNDSYAMGLAVGEALKREDTKLLLSFSDGIHTNGEEYLKGLNKFASHIPVAGGMAADNAKIVETFVFNNEAITSNGVVAVALNSKELTINTDYTFNWLPIGKKMKITKSIKNCVFEIDGMSAVDIYAKYLGRKISDQLPQVGIEFPLILEKNNTKIGRAPIGKNEDGSLIFAGNIEEGEYVRFGIGNVEEILKDTHYAISKMVEEIEYQPEAIFIYSCMARRRFLDVYVQDELKAVDVLGPVSGFFTYGEFFYKDGHTEFLNETMTLVVLSENRKNTNFSLNALDYNEEHLVSNTQHAIAKLANVVSEELAELNADLENRVKENVEYIYKQAYFDKLTSLPNRISLIKKLKNEIGKTIILLNIDDFTTINDFYGYSIGDKVLRKLANILQNYISVFGGELFKLPSDEFAIIKDFGHNYTALEGGLKDILKCIESEEFIVDDHAINITITIAAAFINKEGSGLTNADMALKNAKKNSNSYIIYGEDLELSKEYEKNLKIANQVKSAIANDRIIPYFQPIFNHITGKVDKYEALVRLIDEDGKILSPFHFLEISKKIKLYPKITEIMIEKSFAEFAQSGYDFSINLDFSDILNEKTRTFLFTKMQEYGIASQLTIEILETQEYESDQKVKAFIEDVYVHGAIIAIDDFGSGYANFEYLSIIKSDIIKIDGSLIKNIDTNKNTRLIVETIINFVRKLNKKTVAEFVHNKVVYDIVNDLGVDYIQGYYMGEPKAELLNDSI